MTVVPLTLTSLGARTTADFDQEFRRWADATQQTPLNISGWTFTFKVRPSIVSATILLTATTANGKCVILDAAQGRMAVRFDKAELAALLTAEERLVGHYELAAASPGGVDESWAAGDFVLDLGVAR